MKKIISYNRIFMRWLVFVLGIVIAVQSIQTQHLQYNTYYMKKWIDSNKLYITGAAVGAIAGYLYWQQIGCLSGTCLITSKPLNSSLYGAIMGGLLLGIFKKEGKDQSLPKEDKTNNHDI